MFERLVFQSHNKDLWRWKPHHVVDCVWFAVFAEEDVAPNGVQARLHVVIAGRMPFATDESFWQRGRVDKSMALGVLGSGVQWKLMSKVITSFVFSGLLEAKKMHPTGKPEAPRRSPSSSQITLSPARDQATSW